MRKNIIRGCCIVSVVLGDVCPRGFLEAMRPEVFSDMSAVIYHDKALTVICSILGKKEEVPLFDALSWAHELCAPQIDVFALFEGDGHTGSLLESLTSERQFYPPYRRLFFRRLIEFRSDGKGKDKSNSEELNALYSLFLPLSEDVTKTEEDALRASLLCFRMLSDPSRTVESVFKKLVDIGYFETEFFSKDNPGEYSGWSRWNVVRGMVEASTIIRSSKGAFERPVLWSDLEIAVNVIRGDCLGVFGLECSEDIKFLAAMGLLQGSNISLSDAVFLADAIISDPFLARICEYYRRKASEKSGGAYDFRLDVPWRDSSLSDAAVFWADAIISNPFLDGICEYYRRKASEKSGGAYDFRLDMPWRDPSLVATKRLAEMMLDAEADHTNPDTLVSIFEDAKVDIGLEVEDVVGLWMSITNSKQVKKSLIILNQTNEFLENQFGFPEICEVAMNLVDTGNLDVIRNYLSAPNVCDLRSLSNYLYRLSQEGIDLWSPAEIKAYEDLTGITEERRRSENYREIHKVFSSALQNVRRKIKRQI
ncbi:MAG: hypothetical protein LBJ96_01105 [Holosporaceae bacterium]|jgi:hypothetical protein|nr:hypothetical protein [Holosporaceae bacterium]